LIKICSDNSIGFLEVLVLELLADMGQTDGQTDEMQLVVYSWKEGHIINI